MKAWLVFLVAALAFLTVSADVKVNDVDDQFKTLNIDLNDPKLDIKKAAESIKDQINLAAADHESKHGQSQKTADTEKASDDKDEAKTEGDEGDADVIEEENGVLVLTEKNFDSAIAKHPTILVEFYAPWCGHCKQLAPMYEEAAGMLKDSDPPAVLAKVDATKEEALGSKYGVQGYPTMKVFKNGEVSDYEGPREAQGIVDYMKTRADPDWKPPPSAVIKLTQATFTDFIQEQELALVEFFAPWCGHCKQLAPKYEKAARTLADNDPPIALATVDATEEKELATKYGVSGYPTLKIFRKGRVSDYTGGREEHDIVDHMIGQVGEGSKVKVSLHEVKAVMLPDDVTIGAFFENDQDPRYQPYLDAANELRNDYTFFHTFSKDVRDRYKVNAGSVVVFHAERFYTDHENKWHVLEKSELTSEEVKTFISDHRVPLVGELHSSSENSRYKDKRPLCVFFYTVDFGFDGRKATQIWRKRIASLAAKNKDITFAVADDENMSSKLEDFQLHDSNEDMKVGCYDKEGLKFRMEDFDEWDTDDVEEFIAKFKKGKLKPIIKSQKPPKKQDAVITVVGKTFQEIVQDDKKDVLIEFYAPWCGHCKKLEPEYKKLATKLKNEKNLVIAKLDATANDHPKEYKVSGFPTIYFKPAGESEPKKFEGDRSVEGMEKYLKENAKASFKKKDEL